MRAPRLRLSPRRVVPVLTVLVLVASGLSLALALTRPDPRPPPDLPGAGPRAYEPADLAGPAGPAVEAMVDALPEALGYDFRRLDDDLSEATALMTRGFAVRFRRSFDTTARPRAREDRAVVEAPVRGAGLVRLLDDETALALAYVDQVLVRGRSLEPGDEPRVLSRYRVLVRLVRVRETWKVADISQV